MHEMGIANSVLEAVRAEAPRHPGAETRRVAVRIGELAAVDSPALRFCISVPNRSTNSADRKRLQRQLWFRKGPKWENRVCEGRISRLKEARSKQIQVQSYEDYTMEGERGTKRWVGLRVIADNLINLGRAMATQAR